MNDDFWWKVVVIAFIVGACWVLLTAKPSKCPAPHAQDSIEIKVLSDKIRMDSAYPVLLWKTTKI